MPKEKELWGRTFRLVKKGLDESEVSAFVDSLKTPGADVARKLEHVDSLISELAELHDSLRNKLDPLDSLAKLVEANGFKTGNQKLDSLISLTDKLGADSEKTKHLDSLIRLAESTIIEADKQAETLEAEAEARAKAEEERIIAEARDKATTEEERIVAGAEERAERIRASAEEEAQSILAQSRREAEEEANLVKQEAEQLLLRSKEILEGEIRGMFDQAYERLHAIKEGNQPATASPMSEESIAAQPPESEDTSSE